MKPEAVISLGVVAGAAILASTLGYSAHMDRVDRRCEQLLGSIGYGMQGPVVIRLYQERSLQEETMGVIADAEAFHSITARTCIARN